MPRPDVSEQRKTEILAAALAVFARRGFAATRMSDVAAAAGLSVGGLYWYYPSKEALIAELTENLFAPDLTYLEELNRAGGSIRARLLAFLDAVLAPYRQRPELIAMIYRIYALSLDEPAVSRPVAETYRAFLDGLASLIEQGIAAGEFQACDPYETARILTGSIDGLLLQNLLLSTAGSVQLPSSSGKKGPHPAPDSWETVIQHSLALMLAGLMPGNGALHE